MVTQATRTWNIKETGVSFKASVVLQQQRLQNGFLFAGMCESEVSF